MADTAAIEKGALLWRLGLSGVLDAPEPDAGTAALFAEAFALARGSRDGQPDAPKRVANIFNVFSGEGDGADTFFPFSTGSKNTRLPYPLPEAEAAPVDMETVRRFLGERLAERPIEERSVNNLLRLLELSTVLIPSSAERPDVSLYDEARLTAAAAACLSLCAEESGASLEELRERRSFLLVSGDLAGGIQQFIYTIPSKGALKSLRGRSFYLDVLLEHLADEILEACGLSRSCRLYTGGGHFYLLLPATEKVKSLLASFEEETNRWMLEHFGSRLYLALAWAEGTGGDISGAAPGGVGGMFRAAYEILATKKLRRYSPEQLGMMFSPDSGINKTRDGSRECGVCHTSSADLAPYAPEYEKETLACEVCRNLFSMGEKMLKGDGFLLSSEKRGNALPLPGYGRTLYLSAIPEGETPAREGRVRVYWKNRRGLPEEGANYLWLGDYATRDRSGQVVEFEALAKESGGTAGIDRLGVLRADVDNLGAAFVAGFPEEAASLARSATLSRQLSVFFKRYMNDICAGKLAPGEKPFSLLREKEASPRKVHIVYAGGDDLFLVGAWDELIELAVDIRRAFRKFTNGKLTFSAGVGFFKPGVPIATMARETGRLEDAAKENDNPPKDSIALFGTPADTSGGETEAEKPQRYHWDEFVDKVCGEKLAFLRENFSKVAEDGDKAKLPTGMSGFYKILELLREDGEIHLARFAYTLARLEPSDGEKRGAYRRVRERFYAWYKNAGDRRQLRTAVELAVYSLRSKE